MSRRDSNYLEIVDCRHEVKNSSNWMVAGKIYKDDEDMEGSEIRQWFGNFTEALAFIHNTLKKV